MEEARLEEVKRRSRRKHDAQLKGRVVAECAAPGASVAGVALAYGLNANLVHRWRRLAEGREIVQRPERHDAQQFVSLPIAPLAGSAMPGDICIELRRGATSVSVKWPASAASECAVWLRELLR